MINKLKYLDNDYISKVINNLLDLDIIGITGTLGKTSTTHILSEIFLECWLQSMDLFITNGKSSE